VRKVRSVSSVVAVDVVVVMVVVAVSAVVVSAVVAVLLVEQRKAVEVLMLGVDTPSIVGFGVHAGGAGAVSGRSWFFGRGGVCRYVVLLGDRLRLLKAFQESVVEIDETTKRTVHFDSASGAQRRTPFSSLGGRGGVVAMSTGGATRSHAWAVELKPWSRELVVSSSQP
jgi:hypothetical protein